MTTYIPNTFQKPNAVVDALMRFLTSDEYKVLDFAIRHIYGWQSKIAERKARLAISVFSTGYHYTDQTGQQVYCGGTGLSQDTIRRCLKSLESFGLMKRCKTEAGKDDVTNDGQMWEIDFGHIKTIELSERVDARKTSNVNRISKARTSRKQPLLSDKTPLVRQDPTPLVPQDHPPLVGQETTKHIGKLIDGNTDDSDSVVSTDNYLIANSDTAFGRVYRLYEEITGCTMSPTIQADIDELLKKDREAKLMELLEATRHADKRAVYFNAGLRNQLAESRKPVSPESALPTRRRNNTKQQAHPADDIIWNEDGSMGGFRS